MSKTGSGVPTLLKVLALPFIAVSALFKSGEQNPYENSYPNEKFDIHKAQAIGEDAQQSVRDLARRVGVPIEEVCTGKDEDTIQQQGGADRTHYLSDILNRGALKKYSEAEQVIDEMFTDPSGASKKTGGTTPWR